MSTSEALLVSLLDMAVGGLPAFGDVPEARPEEFITVERTGGRPAHIFDSGVYAVQVWALTRARAAALADLVARHVAGVLPRAPRVASASVVSMYHFPDPDSRTPRYQLTVTLVAAPAGG